MKKIPYPLPFEYVRARPAFTVFFPIDILSSSGRPILEGRSYIFKGLLDEYKKCPYQGSRHSHEKPMNAGALKSVIKNRGSISEIIKSFAFVMCSEKETEAGSLVRLWRLAYMGWSAPVFWWLINENNEISVPDDIADLSKFCHGILTLVKAIFFDDNVDRNKYWSAEDLFQYAEERNILVGFNEVCAAPPNVIKSILELVISETSKSSLDCGAFSLEISTKILQFSRYRLTMEYASMAYETVRYIVCRENSDIRPVKQRHAFPYCMAVAAWISEASQNFDRNYSIYRFKKFQGGVCENEFRELMLLCKEFYRGARLTVYQQEMMIGEVDGLMLSIVQHLSEGVITVCELDVDAYNYTKSDLVTFFGPFIAK